MSPWFRTTKGKPSKRIVIIVADYLLDGAHASVNYRCRLGSSIPSIRTSGASNPDTSDVSAVSTAGAQDVLISSRGDVKELQNLLLKLTADAGVITASSQVSFQKKL